MSSLPQTIDVQVSVPVYRRLQRASELTYRSVDEILTSALNVGLSLPPDLPSAVRDELEAMAMFSDAALWAASESSMSPAQQRRMHQLNHAAGTRSLTVSESAEQSQLLLLYQRSVVRRAHALAILSFRGYDLPVRTDLLDVLDTDDDGDTLQIVG